MKQVSVCQDILPEFSLKIRKGGSPGLCRFGMAFTIIRFKIIAVRIKPIIGENWRFSSDFPKGFKF
jgi:hypothetical protein